MSDVLSYTDVTVLQFLTDASRLLDFLATSDRNESFIELASTINVYHVPNGITDFHQQIASSIYLGNNFP